MSVAHTRVYEWEPIPGKAGYASHRLWVPGGWIVRSASSRYKYGTSISQTFVPDENHSWKLDDRKKNRQKE